ncbi:MAG: pyrroline-5-carboxylate reductase [Candidatus Methylarchaceae archaeon HK01M]|nr:pyrroline-5-carboxylate reductase [Candidatus Methylarchaceae archaeon HK01M]
MKIAVIGVGTIGRAIVQSLIHGRYNGEIIATRRRLQKIEDLQGLGVKITSDNSSAVKEADIILLCVKPRDVKAVLSEVNEEVKGKIVVSLVAAISLRYLKRIAPGARFVRAMPNVAVLVQESFTAYCATEDITEEDKENVKGIFSAMGKYLEVEERYMDAITGLSGSAPAYIFTIIEAMMYAGLKVGLPRDLSLFSSAQTVLGSGKLALETNIHSAELKDMVVTPGGVTIEGIYELEDSRIRTAIMRAVEAATQKSQKISAEIEKEQ